MSTQGMLGEIRMFSYGSMPSGWVPCNGQILRIQGNETLWSILGATYGGDTRTTFALPDLRGRVPVSRMLPADVGEKGGEEAHALTAGEMPIHTHSVYGLNGAADSANPTNQLWADGSGKNPFSTQIDSRNTMASASINFEGGGEKHENMSPFVALNFGICVEGAIYGGRDGTMGELMLYAGFPRPDQPKNWMTCEGQLLSIARNNALHSLFANTYGGNGTTTFALPDLRKFAPISCGQGNGLTDRELGAKGGSETVTLAEKELAQHIHTPNAINEPATTNDPGSNIWAAGGGDVRGGVPLYTGNGSLTAMNPGVLSNAGGGKPHNNMPPYIHLTYLVCTEGKFPARG